MYSMADLIRVPLHLGLIDIHGGLISPYGLHSVHSKFCRIRRPLFTAAEATNEHHAFMFRFLVCK